MSDSNAETGDRSRTISPGGWWFLALWSLGLVALFVGTGIEWTRQLGAYRAETERYRQALWLPSLEPGPVQPGQAPPAQVHVGLALDRISEVDPKGGGWTADFHVWFSWTADGIDPGKNFQLENGKVLERERVIAQLENGQHFERWRVTAQMVKSFDARRVPIGDQTLTIRIEDAVDGSDQLRYVVSDRSADIREMSAPEGFRIARVLPAVREINVPTARLATLKLAGGDVRHSVFVVAMLAKSPAWNRYLRLFQALFASVAICLIVFFIKPLHVDPRFGLPVGAFFAAVGNNISVASMMPDAGGITLVQMINAISLVTIFLTLVQSAISLHAYDSLGRERFSVLFDRISFVLIAAGYAFLNVLLPMAAR